MSTGSDAVVVGSGPNGLAAAVTLARAGLSVLVLEAQPDAGGGARTIDLGLADGLRHDLCSAVHPLAWASPFFAEFGLAARGVEMLTPEVSYAHPLAGGRAGVAYHDLERTVDCLGLDGPAWRSMVGSLSERAGHLVRLALGDTRHLPEGAFPGGVATAVRFAAGIVTEGTRAWNRPFVGDVAPALLTGVAAHAIAPQPSLAGAGTSLLLAALAHAGAGWPIPRGGSGAITAALVADLEAHGGRVVTGHPVRSFADLPPARAYLFDTTPRTLVRVLGDRLPRGLVRALRRYRYGDAAAKVDYALSGPVPWSAPEIARAGTVHVGGSRRQMAAAEHDVARGRHAERPMIVASDPTVVDPARASGGLRPFWSYAHVPAGSDRDVTDAVTSHIELYAPGFRDVVVASRCVPAALMESHNQNYVGGDIAAGAVTLRQLLARPNLRPNPYATGRDGIYLCSASTPPGPGVHGLAGWYAARHALRAVFGIRQAPSLMP
jgi:phytoene dehydrogenase-like protein